MTPLIRYLKHAGMTQRELATAAKLGEPTLSRVARGRCSPEMAVRVLAALPGAAAAGFDERHILLPTTEPYASWEPPPGGSAI